MLILLTIVAVAVVVLFLTRAERGRTAAFCIGVLCLTLGARSVALLSDSYSDAFVSRVHAQEALSAPDSTEGTPQGEAIAAEVTSDADMIVAAADESTEAGEEPAVAESTSDDLVIGIVTDA